MRRFYVHPHALTSHSAILDQEESHHLTRPLDDPVDPEVPEHPLEADRGFSAIGQRIAALVAASPDMSLQRLQRRRLAVLCDPAQQYLDDPLGGGIRFARFALQSNLAVALSFAAAERLEVE